MIVYGSGNADGNRHTHVNLPVILAGGGGGTLTPGRYVKAGGVPMTNLFLSMADRLGVAASTGSATRPGGSTGSRRVRKPGRLVGPDRRPVRPKPPPRPSPTRGEGSMVPSPLVGEG